MEIQRGSSR